MRNSDFVSNFILVFLFSFLFFERTPLKAQANLGQGQLTKDTIKPDSNNAHGDILFSIKLGVILPQGLFSQSIATPVVNPANINGVLGNLILPFKGVGGMGAKPGYGLEFEGFSSLRKTKKINFGIDEALDFGYIPLNWNNVPWNNYNIAMGTSPFLYLGFKVGPALYFTPAPDIGIGIYGTIDPFGSAPGGEHALYTYTDPSGNMTTTRYSLRDSSDFHVNINASAGINFYFKAYVLGIEYSWVHTRYNGALSENESQVINGAAYYTSANESFTNVLQTNMLKISLGIRIGYLSRNRNDVEIK